MKENKETTLDKWTTICHRLFPSSGDVRAHPIHSCVIDGRRHYIHAPELAKHDPGYFEKLRRFAGKNNVTLRADRRRVGESLHYCRRKKILPIIFLSFGLLPTLCEAGPIKKERFANPAQQESSPIPKKPGLKLNSKSANFAEKILLEHFVEHTSDPDNIDADIKILANYYSAYPEVINLLQSIKNKEWSMRYAPQTFQTQAEGTRLSVRKVTVYFDPRSAAKLKFYNRCDIKKRFCIASPADALLHELLHAQTILLNTHLFIKQGGMGTLLYPLEHERVTILKENHLYRSMSQRDKLPRPIRNEHTGRHVLVSCVTCLD